jgi:hypothetical protein
LITAEDNSFERLDLRLNDDGLGDGVIQRGRAKIYLCAENPGCAVLAVSPAPPSIAVLPSAEIETQPPWAAAKSPSVAARFEPS